MFFPRVIRQDTCSERSLTNFIYPLNSNKAHLTFPLIYRPFSMHADISLTLNGFWPCSHIHMHSNTLVFKRQISPPACYTVLLLIRIGTSKCLQNWKKGKENHSFLISKLEKWQQVLKYKLQGARSQGISLIYPECLKVKVKSFSHVWLFATPWTVAYQALQPMEIFQAREVEWVAISSSSGSSRPRDWTPVSHIAADALPAEPPEKPTSTFQVI